MTGEPEARIPVDDPPVTSNPRLETRGREEDFPRYEESPSLSPIIKGEAPLHVLSILYSNDGPLTIKRIALLLSHGDYNHRWYDVAKKACQRLLSRGLLVRLKGEYAIADKILALLRSEERRVGKECGSRWTRDGRTEK